MILAVKQGRTLVALCTDQLQARRVAKDYPGAKVVPAGSTLEGLRRLGVTEFPHILVEPPQEAA